MLILLIPTIKGTIHARYSQSSNTFSAIISVPANTTANVYLPLKPKNNFELRVDDRKVKGNISAQRVAIEKVGSGQHVFKIVYTGATR